MAYNPIPLGKITGNRQQLFTIKQLSGGLCENKNSISDSQLTNVINMDFYDGFLSTRNAMRQISGISGKYHSHLAENFFDRILIHCGTKIYSYNGKEIAVLLENVPDVQSIFYTMNATAYLITSDKEIFKISKEFVCEKTEPYAPTISKCVDTIRFYYELAEPINMMTRKVKIDYTGISSISDCQFYLPYPAKVSEGAKLYINDTLIEKAQFYYPKDTTLKMAVSNSSYEYGDIVKIEYTLAGEDEKFEEYFEKIYNSKIAFTYGGTSAKGTRVFLTGCDKYAGWYSKSELKNPLYFPDTMTEVIGDQTEKITAIGKRYEKLFFFTEKHIYSMSYDFSDKEGATFSVSEVNSPVSCTMPQTVQSIDNTLVFANKTNGVYILQSTDIFDELNVLHISDNITPKNEKSFSVGNNFCSCDFDRKYCIFNGEYLYVWDYGRTPYYLSGNPKKSEERLSWHKFSDMNDCVALIPFEKNLLFIKGEENSSLYIFDRTLEKDLCLDENNQQINRDFTCQFNTKSYDLNIPYAKKQLEYFSFDYIKKSENSKIIVRFFGDDEEFFSFSPDILKNEGKVKLKLPSFSAHSFSVSFEITGGKMGISNLIFYSKISERATHNL